MGGLLEVARRLGRQAPHEPKAADVHGGLRRYGLPGKAHLGKEAPAEVPLPEAQPQTREGICEPTKHIAPALKGAQDRHHVSAADRVALVDRASYHTGPYLPDRRASKDQRHSALVRKWLEGHPWIGARFHAEGSGVGQPHHRVLWWRIIRREPLRRTVLCG